MPSTNAALIATTYLFFLEGHAKARWPKMPMHSFLRNSTHSLKRNFQENCKLPLFSGVSFIQVSFYRTINHGLKWRSRERGAFYQKTTNKSNCAAHNPTYALPLFGFFDCNTISLVRFVLNISKTGYGNCGNAKLAWPGRRTHR